MHEDGDSMHAMALKILPYVLAFVCFMMIHDYLQEILQLEFQASELVVPNVFTLFDCLGCVVGPVVYWWYARRHDQTPGRRHICIEELERQRPHLRSVFFPLAVMTTMGVGELISPLHIMYFSSSFLCCCVVFVVLLSVGGRVSFTYHVLIKVLLPP